MTAETTPAAPKLGLPSILSFSAPAVVLGSYAVAFSVFLPQYFASHIGISTALVGVILFIVRFIDIWFDPLIGVAIDRTRTRVGRYRFWMLLGAPIFAVAAFMIYMAPQGISMGYAIFWLLIFYAGTSIMSLSHTSWASVIAPTYDQRSRLFGWMSAIGVVGSGKRPPLPDEVQITCASSSRCSRIGTNGNSAANASCITWLSWCARNATYSQRKRIPTTSIPNTTPKNDASR